MNHPTSQKIEAAFQQAAVAAYEADTVKQSLIELHRLTKAVEDAQFLVDNLPNNAAPSDDAQDILYARLKVTQEALSDALRSGAVQTITSKMEAAHRANETAYKLLQ